MKKFRVKMESLKEKNNGDRMYSTDCGGCVFSQYTDQNITGCLLDRQNKYGYTTVFNDDYSGTRRIVLGHICPAKRTKMWLSEHPSRPELAVRQELYPKVQLIVIVESLTDKWLAFFQTNSFDKYSAVDILVFSGKDVFKQLGYLVNKDRFFLHTCFLTDPSVPFEKQVQQEINYIVREDCKFYLVVDDWGNHRVNDWPDRLDYCLNDLCNSVMKVYENIDEMDVPFNNLLVYTPLHITLGGNGSQSIGEKITIHCLNHESEELVVEVDDFWAATQSESVDGLPAIDNVNGALT